MEYRYSTDSAPAYKEWLTIERGAFVDKLEEYLVFDAEALVQNHDINYIEFGRNGVFYSITRVLL